MIATVQIFLSIVPRSYNKLSQFKQKLVLFVEAIEVSFLSWKPYDCLLISFRLSILNRINVTPNPKKTNSEAYVFIE